MQQENQKRYERAPILDFRTKLSRDGRYWIFERVETWIIPANYLSTITQNHVAEPAGAKTEALPEKPKRRGKRNADSNRQGD